MEQGEKLSEIGRLEFTELKVGDALEITTGQAGEAWVYRFDVTDIESKWPNGVLVATNPVGEEMARMNFSLHGCGRWTTRHQNPVQEQMHAFTPYYDGLIVGSFLWGKPEGAAERIVMDKPGQEISKIAFVRKV